MPLALCTMSHSPLMGINQPVAEVVHAVDNALDAARAFIADYRPDLVVIFGPDHFNGIFYDLLPPFCIGTSASSVGDYRTTAGPVRVDRDAARAIAAEVLSADIDIALSERMNVDHGFAQPLGVLFGSVAEVPTVPIFINSVAVPLGPVRRARLLGRAVGTAALSLDRRVLVVGSGGLSHDPPVSKLDGAPADVAERLIAGRNPTPEQRAERERRVIRSARDFAAGTATDMRPLNPEWDQHLMSVLASGRLTEIDNWTNDWFVSLAGKSSHEVRTWIAAYAALGAAGAYDVTMSFYRPIPEWIAGFGITTARSRQP